jgi:hypothetical protein
VARAPTWAGDKPDSPRLEAVDPAQRLLQRDVELERERVAKERQERLQEAPPPLDQGPPLPDGTTPLHLQPRPDGLAVSDLADVARRRFSPRKSWPEVAKIDQRVHELERKQGALGAEVATRREQHAAAQVHDRQALADWVQAGGIGQRPLPSAPALQDRIDELEAERDATEVAVRDVLADKTALVSKARPKLIKDARKRREEALAKLERAITEAERARDEATRFVEAEAWAQSFPDEVEDLRLVQTRGGRVSLVIPELRSLTTAAQMFEWVRDDLRWLAGLLAPDPADGEPDLAKEAAWLDSTEVREVAHRRNQERLEAARNPQGLRHAEWFDR